MATSAEPQKINIQDGIRDKEAWARKHWEHHHVFQRSLEQRQGSEPFVWFEGPPTANGLPHIGHFLTRIYKDLYGRYKTMQGYYVLRRAGWDTHGLPVELEIEKELGLKTKKDIEAYGVAKFNAKCKESVWKYKSVWEKMTKHIGFWLDTSDAYITYDPKYIESVWQIIKQIGDKGLLYQGHKVLPFCTRCGTGLSSHEVAQGYKEVTDTSAYVKFKVKGSPSFAKATEGKSTYLLIWTTTPWTLPGNVALAVGKDIEYALAKLPSGEKILAAKELLPRLAGEDYTIASEMRGSDLVGLAYEPLFDIKPLQSEKSYKVYAADFVTTQDGTGIVHTAVMYGEDDYELGKAEGLPAFHTVDEQGHFVKEVPLVAGKYVKSAEQVILDDLETRGLLFKVEPYTHTYPHCWRCKTPLLYYAKSSWFIRMSSLRQELGERNATVNWVPKHIRDGRFGEFLKEAKDWALSRERYWGTPLPIWRCQDCGKQRVVGSYDELEQYRATAPNTYYLVRHGLSTKNGNSADDADDLIASRLEHDTYDLTPEGIEQIEKIARDLKGQGIDAIVASPFVRTRHTANIIGQRLGVEVLVDERLKEIDHGTPLEGKPHALCDVCGDTSGLDSRLFDGETRREVKGRMMAVIKDLEKEHQGKKIIIVSHGDPLWLLKAALLNFSDTEVYSRKREIYPRKGEMYQTTVKNWPYNDKGELDPHKPWIDAITLKCEVCPGTMTRVSELIDVWFDSGSMPYAQWHYPFENQARIDGGTGVAKQFPADFIVEAIDQTRGWFYTMLAISTALGRPAPYKNVGVLGFVTNDKGKKLSKSEGAGEGFEKILEENSVDALRWYFYTVSDLGDDKRFSLKDVEAKIRSFHGILFNTVRFYNLYKSERETIEALEPKTLLDTWLMARLESLTHDVTQHLDEFRPTAAARLIENFVINDLSQWWLRLSRSRFQQPVSPQAHAYISNLFKYVLERLSLLMAPFMPFISEWLYHDLIQGKEGDSVHLTQWPKAIEHDVQKELIILDEMREIQDVVTKGLAQRKASQLKVRQPLASVSLKKKLQFQQELEEILKDELNVKKVSYDPAQSEEVALDTVLTKELTLEGYARDLVRQIQDMRKEAGYAFEQKVSLAWQTDSQELAVALEAFAETITKDTLLSDFSRGHDAHLAYDVEKEFELKPGVKVWLGIKA